MTTLTISTKGWVVIPAELREKYQLKPGAKVRIIDYGGVLSIVPELADPVAQAFQMFSGKSSLTQALLQEHKKERRDDRRR